MSDEVRGEEIENKLDDLEISEDLSSMYDDIMAQEDGADPELDSDNDNDDEVVDPADDSTDDEGSGADEIDPNLVVQAREMGWDDDTIVELASKNPEAFEKMFTPVVTDPVAQPDLEVQDVPTEEDESAKPTLEIPEGLDDITRQTFEAMAKRLEKAEAGFQTVQQMQIERAQADADAFDQRVDTVLDSLHDECPHVGLNASLTEQELQARVEIFEIAKALKDGSLEEKLNKAVRAYNGMYGDPEGSLRKKLYKRRETFSPRPGGKKQKEKFASDDDRAKHAMEEKMRELGLED